MRDGIIARIRSEFRGKGFVIAFLPLFLFFFPALSYSADVAVVKSSDIKPYYDALRGFRSACDCSVEEVDLSDPDHDDGYVVRHIRDMEPSAVLVIGLDALKHVQAIKDLPVIYTLVPHLPPGMPARTNLSGISMQITPETYIDAMLSVLPGARRIGLVYNPRNSGPFVAEATKVAGSKGVELVARAAQSPTAVPALIDTMKDRADVLWMLPDPTVVNSVSVEYMLLSSFQNRAPIFTFSRKYVEMGCLAGLSVDPYDLGVQAGEVLKELLRPGAKGGIRREARKAALTINKKVASKLGIKIRDEILKKADVIQ